MKFKIFLAYSILISIFFSNCTKISKSFNFNKKINNKKNDLNILKLKGSIKKITKKEFKIINNLDNKENLKLLFSNEMNFNVFGFEIGNTYYKSNLELDYKIVKFYDKKNNVIESDKYNNVGSIENRFINKFDNKQNIIEQSVYNNLGEFLYKFKFIYNDNGNLLESIKYNAEKKIVYKEIKKYDYKNNNIGSIGYNADNNIRYKYIFKYNNKGEKIEINMFGPKNNLEYKNIKRFDEFGNEVESIEDSNKSTYYTYSYKYDLYGNVLEKNQFQNTYLISKTIYQIEYYKWWDLLLGGNFN